MPTKEPTPPPPTDTEVPPLTYGQYLELAACYAEFRGADPNDRPDWRTEMVRAKVFVQKLMEIWDKRSKKMGIQNLPTSPIPPLRCENHFLDCEKANTRPTSPPPPKRKGTYETDYR